MNGFELVGQLPYGVSFASAVFTDKGLNIIGGFNDKGEQQHLLSPYPFTPSLEKWEEIKGFPSLNNAIAINDNIHTDSIVVVDSEGKIYRQREDDTWAWMGKTSSTEGSTIVSTGHRLYRIGGVFFDTYASDEVYCLEELIAVFKLPFPLAYISSVKIGKRVYLFGGERGSEKNNIPTDGVMSVGIDANNKLETKVRKEEARMPFPVAGGGIVCLQQDKVTSVFYLGGWRGEYSATNIVRIDIKDTGIADVRVVGKTPHNVPGFTVATILDGINMKNDNKQVYIIGGEQGGRKSADIWRISVSDLLAM